MPQKLSGLLANKNRQTTTIFPDQTLRFAIEVLCEQRIGALPVISRSGDLLGIISERDLLRVTAARVDLDRTIVAAEMTREVLVAVESDDLERTSSVMTEARVRHLPVMREGRLVGIVSIGDVVNALRTEESHELRFLKDYIYGNSL